MTTTTAVLDALAEPDVWPEDVARRFPGMKVEGIRKLATGEATALCAGCNGHGSSGADPHGRPIECAACRGAGAL